LVCMAFTMTGTAYALGLVGFSCALRDRAALRPPVLLPPHFLCAKRIHTYTHILFLPSHGITTLVRQYWNQPMSATSLIAHSLIFTIDAPSSQHRHTYARYQLRRFKKTLLLSSAHCPSDWPLPTPGWTARSPSAPAARPPCAPQPGRRACSVLRAASPGSWVALVH
jgi:hypothetical protein